MFLVVSIATLISDLKMSFKDQLTRKVSLIAKKYGYREELVKICNVQLNQSEQTLFLSMERWHRYVVYPIDKLV